jgi:hypothetical protein
MENSYFIAKVGCIKLADIMVAHYFCVGRICCRFDDNDDHMRGLGGWFMRQQTRTFQPYFEIKEHGQNRIAKKV